MTNIRTFSEVALFHLPPAEIDHIYLAVGEGMTAAYKNDAGFFIWAKVVVPECPILTRILSTRNTDYVLFDYDVEPDPALEVFQ